MLCRKRQCSRLSPDVHDPHQRGSENKPTDHQAPAKLMSNTSRRGTTFIMQYSQDWGHEYVTLIRDGCVVIQSMYEQIGGQNLDLRLQNDSLTIIIMAEADIPCVETR